MTFRVSKFVTENVFNVILKSTNSDKEYNVCFFFPSKTSRPHFNYFIICLFLAHYGFVLEFTSR